MSLLISYLLLALLVSCFCSVAEAVLLSVRPTYVEALKQEGSRSAPILDHLLSNLDRPLAAILTANTIAHTIGAAGVGAQASVVFGSEYLGITSAVLTLLILVVSEIIPKTLGATYWQQLAPLFAILIHRLTQLLAPFVWVSSKITNLLSGGKVHGATFTRAEMAAMVEIGAKEGMLEDKELKIVQNLLKLKKLSVRVIMTPRPVVFSLPSEMTVQEYFSAHEERPFSRIPIYEGSQDDITGYILRTDLLIAQAKDNFSTKLEAYKRSFLIMPDSVSASHAYDRLMHEKCHIALVVDEYGTVQGLVSLEDIIETLIGLEITDESDTVEDMQTLAHQRWRSRMESIGIDPDSISPSPNLTSEE
ncbi:hemolysin family protein [Temperatibacter marinus]|uniref:Hemolysin family protein n=1 Tax=Temperatibacter marinus TaxID=1456591 RepID=A0AA52EEK4_9PROT|nr:hemolysin family protein [Temperatibacter marinus]WND02218.1 hemolysin family protein [Temperatibacter marinus]